MSENRFGGAYARPEVYDILHSAHTRGEVDLLLRCASDWRAPAGRWLEPACGTGRYLRELARRGVDSTGFDLDPGMLDYARGLLRRRGLDARVRLLGADMTEFASALGRTRFAVAINPVNTIRHLESGRAMARHLREVARVLRPGGLYLVGISLSRYESEEPSEDVWVAQRGRVRVRQIVQYLPPDRRSRAETVLSHLQVDRPGGREYFDARYTLRSYDHAQWTGLVRRSPFHRVAALDDLGNELTDDLEANYQIEILRRN